MNEIKTKKMKIFEPAMCCSTGLCGVGVNKELLRISTVLNNLKNIGVVVERYNLSNAPQEFVNNKVANEFINKNGIDELPLILVDNEIAMYGRYPNNMEISKLLNISVDKFVVNNNTPKRNNGCGCNGGCC
jgi:hypothetical protein